MLGVGQLKRGMQGYGLTVFEGTKPERFDVEIIGVLHNFQPRQELILIKTRHPRLDVATRIELQAQLCFGKVCHLLDEELQNELN